MSTQFHTPSLGDEAFDLTDVEPNESVEFSNSSKPQVSLKLGVPEPVKPVSAYALFFRDTVSAIKAQNPNTSFEDISKTVNSMWQVLDPAYKNVYNKKSDLAKKEYIQKMANYRNSQLRQIDQDEPSLNSYNHVDVIQHANISAKSAQLASRPTVFTVSKSLSGSSVFSMNDQLSNNIVYSNNVNSQLVGHTIINQELQNVQCKSDAGSVQTCLRENCNKYAIINPDWEDEYCSNECVVLHCRNVFNQWVRSNMEGQV